MLIAAHGNSLRALVKYLDNIPEEEIVGLNIPTGIPLVYELDDDLKPIKHYYLGNDEAVAKAMEAVKKRSLRVKVIIACAHTPFIYENLTVGYKTAVTFRIGVTSRSIKILMKIIRLMGVFQRLASDLPPKMAIRAQR